MKFIKLLFLLSFISLLLGGAALFGAYWYIKPDLPSVTVLKEVKLQTPMRIFSQDGKLISQYGVKRRIPVALADVPEQLIQAILATEDSRFYEHIGIDPIGLARATLNLLMTGEKQQGASTLTMQLARGFFLTREKTYLRKIKEIFIALHIEQVLSKEEILELYLNKVELGHRAFGVGAAAQVYYGKPLSALSLPQLAMIAGLPKAPSALNPISRPDRAIERRRVVLLRMLDQGYITREQFVNANAAPISARRHGAEIELDAPYLAEHIYNEMVARLGKEEAETGGYAVYATATAATQQAAQAAVVQNLHDYDERHGYRGPLDRLWDATERAERPSDEQLLAALAAFPSYHPLEPAVVIAVAEQEAQVLSVSGRSHRLPWEGLDWARPYETDSRQGPDPKKAADILALGDVVYIRQHEQQWRLAQLPDVSGALVALNPANGAVEAMVGGYSFYQSQFNRVTQARRQVGSNIKPFIYSAALAHGYTLASIINDAPINQWDASSGVAWRPQNSPAEYDGPIRMRVALGKSKNVVSVRLLRGVGLSNIIDHLSKFGFEREDIPRDETISLGSSSHTPLEVARAIAVIANGGFLVEPHFIERVENDAGEVLWRADPVWACDPCEPATASRLTVEEQLARAFAGSSQVDKPARRSAARVIPAENAFLVAEMMRTAVRSNGDWGKKTYWLGTGWRARNLLGREDIAGKTGTTNDARDTWFSGFHPNLVATTWVGFDDMSRQLGRTSRNQNLVNRNPERFNWIGNALIGAEDGAKAAGPAWIRFIQVALQDEPVAPWYAPEGVVRVRIDRTSGKLTRRADHTTLFEYFMQGTEPTLYVRDDEIIDPALSDDINMPVADEIF